MERMWMFIHQIAVTEAHQYTAVGYKRFCSACGWHLSCFTYVFDFSVFCSIPQSPPKTIPTMLSLIIIRNVFSNFPIPHSSLCLCHIYLMSYQNISHFNWEEQESGRKCGKRGKAHNSLFFWYFQNLFESEWNFPSVRLCTITVVDMKFLKGTCLLNFISFDDSFPSLLLFFVFLLLFLWIWRAQREEKKNY